MWFITKLALSVNVLEFHTLKDTLEGKGGIKGIFNVLLYTEVKEKSQLDKKTSVFWMIVTLSTWRI